MIQTRPSEYDLFVLYGKKTKEFLTKVFYLNRYKPTENVDVAYATPPRAFAKFLVPVLNGGNLNPTVTFYLEGTEYLEGENLLGFVKEYKKIGEKAKAVPAPLIFKLNYKVTITTATPIDCDRLSYQALAYARKNNKMATFHDGQWIEWHAHSLSDDSSPDPGLDDKIVKKSFSLSIPRAYLPVDFAESYLINNIDLEEEINSEKEVIL